MVSSGFIDRFHRQSQTLVAFAMQFYYQDSAHAIDKNEELFTTVNGGVSCNRTDVGASECTPFTPKAIAICANSAGARSRFSSELHRAPSHSNAMSSLAIKTTTHQGAHHA